MDLKGIVCKLKDSPYKVTEKPSRYWIKVKNPKYQPVGRPRGIVRAGLEKPRGAGHSGPPCVLDRFSKRIFRLSSPHRLDEARLKVIWANKHIDTFNQNSNGYFHPDTTPIGIGMEPKTDGWNTYPVASYLPPQQLSLPIGDCLYCLRCVLD